MAESTNPAAEDSETNAEACHAVKEDAEARHVAVVVAAEEDDWDCNHSPEDAEEGHSHDTPTDAAAADPAPPSPAAEPAAAHRTTVRNRFCPRIPHLAAAVAVAPVVAAAGAAAEWALVS